jgi:Rrf2 family protein
MFSKACEYAIRAMVYIGQKSRNGDRVGIKEIAKGVDSPEPFLAKILQELVRQDLLSSIKGPNGGFYLEPSKATVTLADIVRTVDGDQLFTGCGLGLSACSEKRPCPIHDEFKIIRKKIQNMLDTTRVTEFNESLDRGIMHLKRF